MSTKRTTTAWISTSLTTMLLLVGCDFELPPEVPPGPGDEGSMSEDGDASASTTASPEPATGSTTGDEPMEGESTEGGTTEDAPMEGESTGEGTAGGESSGDSPLCGDGIVNGDEWCDGAELGGEDCESQGFDAGTLGCAEDCTFDVSECAVWSCGNGVVEGKEVCDGDALGGQDCVSLGFDGGVLACGKGCVGYDTSGCTSIVCGDGIVEGDEVCDGAALQGEDCESQGLDGGTLGCLGDCSGYDTSECIDYDGDCCSGHDSPGCADPTCTEDICADDPFCCDVMWDSICAAAAYTTCASVCDDCGDDLINSPVEVCDGTDLGGADCASQGYDSGSLACAPGCAAFDTSGCIDYGGACCEPNETLGCEDAGCTADICAVDPFCCEVIWDGLCAAQAAETPSCQNLDSCPSQDCGNGVIEVGEACDGAALDGQDCASQGYDYGMLDCVEDCSGFSAAACASYVGDCCEANGSPGCDDAACTAAVCGQDPSCCGAEWNASCGALALEQPECLGAGGSCHACGDGVAEGAEACDGLDLQGADCQSEGFSEGGVLACADDCMTLDVSGCFQCGDDAIQGEELCDGADLGGVDCIELGYDGGALGCGADCGQYDPSGCATPGGSCCEEGGLGCDVPVVESCVCELDAWCCNIEWDGICVAEATDLCGATCS